MAPQWLVEEASGIPEILKAVREQAGMGADWIKVYADYGRGPGGKQVPTFSMEELRALVEESHSSGRLVAAHAMTAEGMRRAVEAGVDTIEHGYGGTEEVFARWPPRGRGTCQLSQPWRPMLNISTVTSRGRVPPHLKCKRH